AGRRRLYLGRVLRFRRDGFMRGWRTARVPHHRKRAAGLCAGLPALALRRRRVSRVAGPVGRRWTALMLGRHSSQDRVIRFRIDSPAAEQKPAAQLLILVRDGKVTGLLVDSPIEATISTTTAPVDNGRWK